MYAVPDFPAVGIAARSLPEIAITFERGSTRFSTSPSDSTLRFFGLVPSSLSVLLPIYTAEGSATQYCDSPVAGSSHSLPMIPLRLGEAPVRRVAWPGPGTVDDGPEPASGTQ